MNHKLQPPSMWDGWPEHLPHPTQSEWDAALERYRLDMDEAIKRGYYGDALCGLSFMMTTYNVECWLPYFFPAGGK